MDDPPARIETPQDQGKHPATRACRAFELPVSQDPGGTWTEAVDLEIRESEPTHRSPVMSVVLAVGLNRRLPAAADVATGGKDELGAMPVAGHEGGEVTPVPGGGLPSEQVTNGRFWPRGARLGLRAGHERENQ